MVNESYFISVCLFVCCVQSRLHPLLIRVLYFRGYKMYLTPHCLLRTLDDLVFAILFPLTSELALGGLSFLPWPL